MENIQQINKGEIKFIYIDVDDITDEIEQLINKGLIKYVYGEEACEPEFIFLAKNEDIIKNTLTSDYRILNIVDKLSEMFDGADMTVRNLWRNELSIYHGTVESLISDDLYGYISEDKQKEIFYAKNLSEKITEIFNKIGREQLKMQIKELLKEVDNAEFI